MTHHLDHYPVKIRLPVQWGEMDFYRHVNNIVYFRYFESVRIECCRLIRWEEFERETGIGPILATTNARFRKALTYPDTVTVGARLHSMAEDRFTQDYVIWSDKMDAPAAEGQGTIVSYHYAEGRKVPIPAELRRRIEELG